MKQQDFEAETTARTKKSNLSNLRFGASSLCSLVTMLSLALGGCNNNEVQITGKVKRIESKFVSTKVHKDEKTGKLTSNSYSSCNILIKSMGVLYDLKIYDSYNTELCGKVLEESAGVSCCIEFKMEYENGKSFEESEHNKKLTTGTAAWFGQCKGIKCEYPLFQYSYDFGSYAYIADIDDGSKSPTITLITNPEHIKDKTDNKSNLIKDMKEVLVDRSEYSQYRKNPSDSPSQVSIQPSPYVAAERVKSSILQSFKQWLY